MAGYHVSLLKPNDVSANLRSGTFVLKWSEEGNKPGVINNYLDIYVYNQVNLFYLGSNCLQSIR
jgi:hypothetical protein